MKSYIPGLLLLTAFIFTAPLANAEELYNCDGTQGQMNECTARVMQSEEKALDLVYQEALKQAGDELDKKKLEASHKAWLAFRDAECVYESDAARGGSMEPMLLAMCHTTLTRTRVVQLQGQLAWPADLALMISRAGDKLPKSIFWNPNSAVTGDFDVDGIYDDAYLGMIPGQLPNPHPTAILAVMFGGTGAVAQVRIPVGEQNGLCAPSIELRSETPDNEPIMLVIDDGACDAFRFRILKDQKTFELHRN